MPSFDPLIARPNSLPFSRFELISSYSHYCSELRRVSTQSATSPLSLFRLKVLRAFTLCRVAGFGDLHLGFH